MAFFFFALVAGAGELDLELARGASLVGSDPFEGPETVDLRQVQIEEHDGRRVGRVSARVHAAGEDVVERFFAVARDYDTG